MDETALRVQNNERKRAYKEIGKAYQKLIKAGYNDDLNIMAIMHELQQKFKS